MSEVGDNANLVRVANDLILKEKRLPHLPPGCAAPLHIQCIDGLLTEHVTSGSVLLPNLGFQQNQTVVLFSDYGGEHVGSQYFVYSFVLVAYDVLGPFFKRQRRIREQSGLLKPYKEIAFKDLRYGPLNRALSDLLRCADHSAQGLLFNLIVDRSLASIVGANEKDVPDQIADMLAREGLGSWKPAVAERLMRVTHVAAYLLTLLADASQTVCWISDQDAIAGSSEQRKALGKLLDAYLAHYGRGNSFKEVGFGFSNLRGGETPAFDLDDLVALPDLAAGAIESYFTRSDGGSVEPEIRSDVDEILLWLCSQGLSLKKVTLRLAADPEGGGVRPAFVSFERKEVDEEAIIIPVVLPPSDQS